jgi:hypothetical protein
MRHGRGSLVLLAVELTSELCLGEPTPLFEIERNVSADALIAKSDDPLTAHGTSSAAALASNDNPVDTVEADCPNIFEERLTR